MNEAYSALSIVYEYLISDCDYKKWSQYVLAELKNNSAGHSGVDCACGSGFFTRAIKKSGYEVIGVDSSNEMLNEASKNNAKDGLKITLLNQDITNLSLQKKVDFITVINDAVNYIMPSKLKKLFTSFYNALNKNGLLLFDFSSKYKLENIIGNNLFGEDDDKLSYLWFNTLSDGYVDMDLSIFIKDECGQKYTKKEETHRQYIHTADNVKSVLEGCAFQIIKITGHLGEELTETSQRVVFVAKKI